MQSAPFTSNPVEIARTEQRYQGIDWSERRGVGLLQGRGSRKPARRRCDRPPGRRALQWNAGLWPAGHAAVSAALSIHSATLTSR